MHLQGSNPPDKQDVISTMKSYDIPVYVTEFDVNMKDVGGTQEDRFSQQAIIYKNMLEAALELEACKDFLIFGLVDKLSVWENLPNLWATLIRLTQFLLMITSSQSPLISPC